MIPAVLKTVLKNLGFTRICREIVNVAIYALYPESFCGKDLAVRKVFAFSDSGGKGGSVTISGRNVVSALNVQVIGNKGK